ncbi:MAG: DUF6531 domain-containing protein [Steroidobacteraceae bacterium]
MKTCCAGRTAGLVARIVVAILLSLLLPSISRAQAGQTCGPSPVGATCAGAGPASLGNAGGADVGAGNPINILTGNKYQREVDLAPMPGELGVELVRHYNSLDRGEGSLGVGWRWSYDTELVSLRDSLQILESDGGRISFSRKGARQGVCNGDDPAQGALTILPRSAAPAGYRWQWVDGRQLVFDVHGKLIEIHGAQGGLLTLTRGARGELLAVQDPLGRRLEFEYRSTGPTSGAMPVAAVMTPLGRISYELASRAGDKRLDLESVLLADRRTVRRYHHEPRFQAGNAHALTGVSVETRDARGATVHAQRRSRFAYGPGGKARWSMRGDGLDLVAVAQSPGAASLRHPGTAVLVNATGEITKYRFAIINGSYRLLDSAGPGCAQCGATNLHREYDAGGHLVSVQAVDPSGALKAKTEYEHDATGRVAVIRTPSVVTGSVHERRFVYDGKTTGRLVSMLESGFSSTGAIRRRVDLAYDPAGRLVRQGTSRFSYDDRGRLIERRVHSRITRYQYDALSRPASILLEDGRLASYEYDELGRVASIQIGGRCERYAYDAAGRLERVMRPNGETLRYEYDAADRPISIVDGAGRRIRLERDAEGELRRRELIDADGTFLQKREEGPSDVAGALIPVRFDAGERPIGIAGIEGGYEYDDFGRLSRQKGSGGDVRFEYDDEDRLAAKLLPDGTRVRFDYERDGRRITRRSPDTQTRLELGANGKPSQVTYAEGEEHFEWDDAVRLTRHEWRLGGRSFDTTFSYGSDGRLTARRLPGGEQLLYQYRELPGANAGLLKSIRVRAPGLDASVVDELNAPGDSPTRRRFKLMGNVAYERLTDVQGRLRRVGAPGIWSLDFAGGQRQPTGTAPTRAAPSGTSESRAPGVDLNAAGDDRYEWSRESLLQSAHASGGQRVSFGYDAAGQRVRKTVVSRDGSRTTRFLYEDDRLLAEIDDHGAVRVQYIWLDEQPVAMIRDGKLYGIVADDQFEPRAIYDSQGRVPVEGFTNLRGSHRYLDEETGLLYNGRRYLDPHQGRYLSADPLGLAGGPDPVSAQGLVPARLIDLHGTQAQPSAAQDPDVGSWTFEQKLAFVFEEAARQIQDHELAAALRELVSPAALATTAVIFTTWAASQFTPYGWVGDLALTGIGALFVGKSIWDVIETTYGVARGLVSARCEQDLRDTSTLLAGGLSRAAAALVAAAGPLAAARIARLLRTVFRRDVGAVKRSSILAAVNQSRFGAFNPARGAYSGRAANQEWIRLQRASGRSDAHPPWDPLKSVVDTWLNPGEKIYVIQVRNAGPGGWATFKQYRSLQEARDELAVLQEFKRSDTDLVLQEYTVKTAIPVREGYAGPQVSGWPASESYVGGGTQVQFLVDLRVSNWDDFLSPSATFEIAK